MNSILSLDPGSRKTGYAYFEGRDLIDWGVKRHLEGPSPERLLNKGLDLVSGLLSQYQPDVIILPEPSSARTAGARKLRFLKAIRIFLDGQANSVVSVTNKQMRQCFSQVIGMERVTKQKAMSLLAGRFPELGHHLPRPRKSWQPQDYWIPMFDAVARGYAWILCHDSRN